MNRFPVVLLVLTLAVAAPFAALADPPAAAGTEAKSNWGPSLSPLVGVSVPVTGTSLGFRLGVKATLADLSPKTPGLFLIVPLALTFEGQITGGELAAGFEYQRGIGSGALAWYAAITLGYRHDHQVVPVRFLGYQVLAGNFFVARLAAGLVYRFSDSIRAFVEPVSFGVYQGTGTAVDWAPLLGAEFRI